MKFGQGWLYNAKDEEGPTVEHARMKLLRFCLVPLLIILVGCEAMEEPDPFWRTCIDGVTYVFIYKQPTVQFDRNSKVVQCNTPNRNKLLDTR